MEPSLQSMIEQQYMAEVGDGLFLGITSEEKDRVAFDSRSDRSNHRYQFKKTHAAFTGQIRSGPRVKSEDGSYLTLYSGTSRLVIYGNEVKLDPVTSPKTPPAAKFVEHPIEPNSPPPRSVIGRECSDCFKLLNLGTETFLVLMLDGPNKMPRLETLSMNEIHRKRDFNAEIFYLMTIYSHNGNDPYSDNDTAVYFPSKEKNYYLKPDKDRCTVVPAVRKSNDDDDTMLNKKYLWFSREYKNHGNQ